MAQNKAANLYIEGTNIPTIADSIKAGLPIDVYKTQQVSTQSGVGTVGYESLEDSKKKITFQFPLTYRGVNTLDLIKASLNTNNGSHVTVVDQGGATVYDYIECYVTESGEVEFNGEKRGELTMEGTAIV